MVVFQHQLCSQALQQFLILPLVRALSHSHFAVSNQYPTPCQVSSKISSTPVFQRDKMFSRNHITVLVKKDPEDKSFWEPLDPPKGASYPFCCTFKQDFTRLPYIKLLRKVKIFPKHLTTQSFFFPQSIYGTCVSWKTFRQIFLSSGHFYFYFFLIICFLKSLMTF